VALQLTFLDLRHRFGVWLAVPVPDPADLPVEEHGLRPTTG
jgi:hypothetical protein